MCGGVGDWPGCVAAGSIRTLRTDSSSALRAATAALRAGSNRRRRMWTQGACSQRRPHPARPRECELHLSGAGRCPMGWRGGAPESLEERLGTGSVGFVGETDWHGRGRVAVVQGGARPMQGVAAAGIELPSACCTRQQIRPCAHCRLESSVREDRRERRRGRNGSPRRGWDCQHPSILDEGRGRLRMDSQCAVGRLIGMRRTAVRTTEHGPAVARTPGITACSHLHRA